MRPIIIAIDFDGTIVEHKYPAIGKLLRGAKEAITLLHKAGHEIIIWTCRHEPQDIDACKKFLEENEIPYHKINENSDLVPFKPYPKIYADIYVDDRQLGGLPDWETTYKFIQHRIVYLALKDKEELKNEEKSSIIQWGNG